MKVIDLFSGLGGWTQAFMKSHKYTVNDMIQTHG